MAKNKISISFPENKLYLYNYLKTKDNISSYICKLVESDIDNEQNNSDLETKITEIINKVLKNKQVEEILPSNYYTNDEGNLTSEDIDTILNLF